MDKIQSTITSLESVNALLVKEEDSKETADSTPVRSGEMKPNAQDPVQDNGLESDVEVHQQPVHTSPRIISTSSSKKRKATTFHINIDYMIAQNSTVDGVHPEMPIADVKKLIQEKKGIPPDQQI